MTNRINTLLHWCFPIRSDIARPVGSVISPCIGKHQCNNGFIFIPYFVDVVLDAINPDLNLFFFVTISSLADQQRQSPAPWPRRRQPPIHGTAETKPQNKICPRKLCHAEEFVIIWCRVAATWTYEENLQIWYCPGRNLIQMGRTEIRNKVPGNKQCKIY